MGHPAQLSIHYIHSESEDASAQARCFTADLPGGACTVSTPDFIVRMQEDVFGSAQRGSHARPQSPGTSTPVAIKSEALTLGIAPLRPVTIQRISLTYRVSPKRFTHILCNGYQSWTDTQERPIDYYMRGLHGIPKAVVERYVLDGGGDYRFTDYPQRPGAQHGWTYAYLRNEQDCLFVGSLDESNGFTLLRFDTTNSMLEVQPEAPMIPLPMHVPTVLARWTFIRAKAAIPEEGTAPSDALPSSEAAVQAATDRWLRLANVKMRDADPLTGYSSWYRHYDTITEAKLLADLEGARKAFDQLDVEDFQCVFQIDDGYAAVGDWLHPRENRFPNGMVAMAQAIKSAGFTPGLWAAPFVCERESRLCTEHPDWLLRDTDGQPVKAGSHWSGSLALDTRNPEVREYVQRVIRTMVQDWGFRVLKLDFLYAACLIPHDDMNRGQLMADAMALLREAAGDAQILGCGVPLASAFGVVEHCRIGCDVGLDWDDKPPMRLLHRERVSTKNSLANTVYRAPLNGRTFWNDPDVVFLRRGVSLSRAQRDLLLTGDACFGGALLTSDDMGSWNADQLAAFQTALDMQRAANL